MYFNALGSWIRGLLAIGLIVAGVLLVKEWFDELPRSAATVSPSGVPLVRPLASLGDRIAAWEPKSDRSTGLLAFGTLALILAIGGRLVSPVMWKRGSRRPAPRVHAERIRTRHGYDLHVESVGSTEFPTLLLVHGVGSDRTQWWEAMEDLSDRFHVRALDLLGHGRSGRDPRREHSIAAAAEDLDDVIARLGADRMTLAGHSMGGMIALEWCAMRPEAARRLAGLVLIHTTPQNPFTTMAPIPLHRSLQKAVHEPLLRLTIGLAPLVRLMNGLEYLNGSIHWVNEFELFGGNETREQLERTARLYARMDPATVARFTLGMTRFDVRHRLPGDDGPPVLVVAGEKDRTTVPEASRFIADKVPGARLLTLEGTRHMGFLEHREAFAAAVRSLVDRPAAKERSRPPRRASA